MPMACLEFTLKSCTSAESEKYPPFYWCQEAQPCEALLTQSGICIGVLLLIACTALSYDCDALFAISKLEAFEMGCAT